MTAEPLRRLAAALQVDIAQLDAFRKLPAERIARLADAVAAAQDRQNVELDAAIERGLGFVPAPLRGAVRRVLRG